MTDRSAPKTLVLVQELTNTLDVETAEDSLGTPAALAEFARRLDLRLPGLRKPSDEDVGAVRELREALREACLAHTGAAMAPEAAAVLERHLSRAPLTVTVDGAGRARLRPAQGLSGAAALTARIAADVAAAEADGTWQRLKACEAHDCLWVFYDRSPAGRGRWCTMAVCGSRAKMRAYRARRGK